ESGSLPFQPHARGAPGERLEDHLGLGRTASPLPRRGRSGGDTGPGRRRSKAPRGDGAGCRGVAAQAGARVQAARPSPESAFDRSLGAGPGMGMARVSSAAGPEARRRDEVRCVSTVEERQRQRRPRAAETLRAPGYCGRMRRRSSSTMLRHRCPPRSWPPPRKPRARGPSQYPDRLLASGRRIIRPMPSKPRVSLIKTPPPGPESRRLIAREEGLFPHGAYGTMEDRFFIALRASGSLIEDVDGNRFIDFGAGWATNNVGNCNPEVVEAVHAMMKESGVVCWTSAANSAQRLQLAEKLLAGCPTSTNKVLFLTTGTEAVEAALRIMRRASGRPFILSFFGQYHGLSYGAMAAGPLQDDLREDVAPLVNGFLYAPYPYAYRTLLRSRSGGPGRATLDYIEEILLTYEVPASRIAGVLVEPVVGEAGVWIPPDDFLPGLRALCDRHGWYLCIDEVQSGFGRW